MSKRAASMKMGPCTHTTPRNLWNVLAASCLIHALLRQGVGAATSATENDNVIEELMACTGQPAETDAHFVDHSQSHQPSADKRFNDYEMRHEIDEAYRLLEQGRLDESLEAFGRLLASQPLSPRSLFGRAVALDRKATRHKSRHLIDQTLQAFEQVVSLADTPDALFGQASQRLVHWADVLGQLQRAVEVQRILVNRFPGNVEHKSRLAYLYMKTQRIDQAKRLFREVLIADPDNAIAQAYYGHILVAIDAELEEGAALLAKGLASGEPDVQNREFYFRLGQALHRLGRRDEADAVHRRGAQRGFFASAMQRSLDHVPGLTARPVWTIDQSGYADSFNAIAKEWRTIRDEGVALLDSAPHAFNPEVENLTQEGDWRLLKLFDRGVRIEANCKRAPRTCELVATHAPDATSCRNGQIKFSVMHGGTVVVPHTGPANYRLRAHLGLRVPEGAHMRVAGETLGWTEGEWVVFDDSFEHEVWHDGTEARLILIADFWHPDLSADQRSSIEPQ